VIANEFVPDSLERNVCDRCVDEDGQARHCGRPRREHIRRDEQLGEDDLEADDHHHPEQLGEDDLEGDDHRLPPGDHP